MQQIELSTSEVNTLIAALMLTGIRYNTPELKKAHPKESEKYQLLEQRFRDLCYLEDNIATLKLTATFN